MWIGCWVYGTGTGVECEEIDMNKVEMFKVHV